MALYPVYLNSPLYEFLDIMKVKGDSISVEEVIVTVKRFLETKNLYIKNNPFLIDCRDSQLLQNVFNMKVT